MQPISKDAEPGGSRDERSLGLQKAGDAGRKSKQQPLGQMLTGHDDDAGAEGDCSSGREADSVGSVGDEEGWKW